jgi:hypothetical protein
MTCHHNLEEYLIAYLDGAELRGDPKGPLFGTIGCSPQENAYAMICRRAAAAASLQSSALPVSGRQGSRLSQERRHAGKCHGDREPGLDTHVAALRSPA